MLHTPSGEIIKLEISSNKRKFKVNSGLFIFQNYFTINTVPFFRMVFMLKPV